MFELPGNLELSLPNRSSPKGVFQDIRASFVQLGTGLVGRPLHLQLLKALVHIASQRDIVFDFEETDIRALILFGMILSVSRRDGRAAAPVMSFLKDTIVMSVIRKRCAPRTLLG